MHRFDDGRGQRTGDVANAETDDVRIGMGLGIGGNFFGNGSKEIYWLYNTIHCTTSVTS